MSDASPPAPPPRDEDFADKAAAPAPSFGAELWAFLREEKRWWLAPIVLLLLLLGALAILGGTAMAPFIYTLF